MAAVLVIVLCAGFGYAWSVLQSPIERIYGWESTGVSLAYSLTVICSTLASALLGAPIRRLGTKRCVLIGSILFGGGLFLTGVMTSLWQLYFFYSVLTGVGSGLIYPVLMAYIVKLFPERAGFASGLGTAFYGAGAVIWAPVAAAIIEGISFRTACTILGLGFLAVIFCLAWLLKEPPEEFTEAMRLEKKDREAKAAGMKTAGTKVVETKATVEEDGPVQNLRRGQMIRTSAFYLMVLIFTFGLVAGLIVISQASLIMQKQFGFTPVAAAAFVSVYAACNMAGRFIWGTLSDRIGIPASIKAVFVICILSMAGISFVTATVPGIICLGLAASCYGAFASMLTPYTSQIFGPKYITENYGVIYIVFGIASMVSPMLASSIYAASGSYTLAYVLAGVMAAAGLVLSFFVRRPGAAKAK